MEMSFDDKVRPEATVLVRVADDCSLCRSSIKSRRSSMSSKSSLAPTSCVRSTRDFWSSLYWHSPLTVCRILPGTEIMADIGSHHFVKSSGRDHRVLVPQPSDNPNDPLNWSVGWKISAIVASSMVSFVQGFGPLSLAPMFGDYIEAFNCSLADAVQFTGVAILVLGFSNFIWYV